MSACSLQPQSTLQLSSHLVNYVRDEAFKWNTWKVEGVWELEKAQTLSDFLVRIKITGYPSTLFLLEN